MSINVQVCLPCGILSRKDRKKIDSLTDNSLIARIKRVNKFWQNLTETEKKELFRIGIRCALDFAKRPEVIGISGTVATVAMVASTTVVPPNVSVPATAAAAAVGGVLVVGGITYTIYNLKRDIQTSVIYRKWKDNLNEKKFKIFNKIIGDCEDFNKFICPISQTFINVAVKVQNVQSLYQRAYEKELIEAWLDRKEAELQKAKDEGASEERLTEIRATFSPNRGQYFTKKDLVPYENYHYELEECVVNFVKSKEKYLEDRIVEDGLNAIRETCQENRDILFANKIAAIQVFCLRHDLPDSIFENSCAVFRKTYRREKKLLDRLARR